MRKEFLFENRNINLSKWLLVMTVQDSGYYSLLVNGLSPEEVINLQSLMVLAEQKKAQIQSKQIERQGGKVCIFLRYPTEQEVEIIFFSIFAGYAFSQHTIPTSFQFNKP